MEERRWKFGPDNFLVAKVNSWNATHEEIDIGKRKFTFVFLWEKMDGGVRFFGKL